MTVYLLSFNESFLLPQVNAWWVERFPGIKFVLYDNESTDNTIELAKAYGWEVRPFHTEGMSDLVQMGIKNECWKECKDEWCWVSDFDEVPGFNQEDLDKIDPNISVVRLKGYEMIDTAQTIQEAYFGVPNEGYSKACLLRPSKVKEMNYGAGAHQCSPKCEGKFVENILDLYHMKWFSVDNGLRRAFLLGGRQSEDNKRRNWSYHFALPIEDHLNYYMTHFKNREKVR
jgi:hypothetical protein